jgi:hypothetical protein
MPCQHIPRAGVLADAASIADKGDKMSYKNVQTTAETFFPLSVGDQVEITKGQYKGARGVILTLEEKGSYPTNDVDVMAGIHLDGWNMPDRLDFNWSEFYRVHRGSRKI